MNIVVAQYYTSNIKYAEFSKKINEDYCKKNKYEYFLFNDENVIKEKCEDRTFHWYKPHLITDVLNKYPNCDYVLFLDMDAIFSNFDRRIEEFIFDDISILFTKDYGNCLVNTGVILFKNDDYTKEFLKTWWFSGFILPKYKTNLWWEQSVIDMVYENLNDKNKIKIIDNYDFNSKYYNNNFIFHAFAYGSMVNKNLDNIYNEFYNIEKPKYESLKELCKNYNTDKYYGHDYFELIYDKVLSPLKYDVKTLIEIGVYDGDSIFLWRDFFENANIIGIEKYLENSLKVIGDKNFDRIEFLKRDCSLVEDLNNIVNKYTNVDVIIDDASHKMLDQQLTLSILFKSLKSKGIYILEDLHTSLECINPEKDIFEWGDRSKSITLDVLKNFIKTGKIISDYMTNDDIKYLEENIESVEIYQTRADWSITSIIRKK